ncbi:MULTISPECIES: TetR/AcrR family transcriptional regulator [Streptococcus]|uniref:TetR family transcriptional regulator n=1 Tax=Streptococcus zhangguiae TaxID=2664091 RepID=A0A6I4RG29_9STRE|nr:MULTISPECIES: TetR/AcrR family transcriptional regulator [unclassified Streptococcus]MWV55403.1 TetR family transcriptional regulator [Streptococcus sp. zg-70]QTH47599.1 TetR/AcrR family transcriptional regulator [Streptococcus sp. zg-86]
MKQDLRFQKTELALQKAFLDLLQTKDIAKISVKEICTVAQVSRNAFYQHYETKEHLYDSMLKEILLSIEEACKPLAKDLASISTAERRLFLDNILRAVEDHRFVIYQLLTSEPAAFSAAFQEMLLSANLQGSKEVIAPPHNSYIHVFSGGVSAFVSYWLLETSFSLEEAQERLFAILGQMMLVSD